MVDAGMHLNFCNRCAHASRNLRFRTAAVQSEAASAVAVPAARDHRHDLELREVRPFGDPTLQEG